MTLADRWRLAAGVGVVALALLFPASTPSLLLDRVTFDLLAPRPEGAPSVTGVAITPEDVAALPRFGVTPGTWPWKRLAHGAVVHALQALGARGVVFTLFFEHRGEEGSDAGFARELAGSGLDVTLATYLTPDPGARRRAAASDLGWPEARDAGLRASDLGAVRPLLPELEAVARVGAVNLPEGGLVAARGVPLVYRAGERLVPSLALAAVAGPDLESATWEPGPTLVVGSRRFPLTPDGRALLRIEPVPRLTVREVLERFGERVGPDPAYQGGLFVVGLEGTALGAVHEVPGGPALPSYQVQAGAMRALHSGALVEPMRPGEVVLLLAALLLASAHLARRGAPARRLLPVMGCVAVGLAALALALGWWISPSVLLAGIAFGAGGPALLEAQRDWAEQRRRDAEMRRAEEIARGLLPTRLPEGVRGALVPARVAAGDYYDAVETAAGTKAVLVADVSGKGLDGALLAGQLRAAFRAVASTLEDPGELLARLEDLVGEDLRRSGRLVTALCVFLSPDGALRAAAAAHPPALVVRPGGEVREVPARGRPLGYAPGTRYRVVEDRLGDGDWAVLLSDGVLEEPDARGERPGVAGIRSRLEALAPPTPASLFEALLATEAPPRDDQTVVLLEGGSG